MHTVTNLLKQWKMPRKYLNEYNTDNANNTNETNSTNETNINPNDLDRKIFDILSYIVYNFSRLFNFEIKLKMI